MTINKALMKLKQQIGNRKVLGYWDFKNEIVFNVEPRNNTVEPAQFVVPNNGEVYATNPLNHNITKETMKKL